MASPRVKKIMCKKTISNFKGTAQGRYQQHSQHTADNCGNKLREGEAGGKHCGLLPIKGKHHGHQPFYNDKVQSCLLYTSELPTIA